MNTGSMSPSRAPTLAGQHSTGMNASLARLTKQLSASFNNQRQAFENPPLYGHILVRFRPLPQLEAGSLLLEQAYAVAPNEPYRIRVLRPTICTQRGLIIDNYAIQDNQRFWGAIEDSSKRELIKESDLSLLKGCTYLVSENNQGFRGEVEPGCNCIVKRKGLETYLVSSFELSDSGMTTIDRGHDPKTHEHLWGSIAGPFQFEKTVDYSSEIPSSWEAM